ncbi:tRNA (guanosine(37)-N1)-methyltransferase TrmD [Georgenia sp. Z1344]|uniref:tRNA (guanosine(37)-N1)-methyltransferase TrmD n=1 Tax=Georgenia sp. Z1344 TaxID=3416706 RepID=UPI003CEC5CD4
MRIDVVTIFPDYLAPLDLSLIGKARRDGLVDLAVHDLRDVTTDRHRTVDDTPAGGGAGMVMRADVWGEALDPLLAVGGVLAIPAPAGEPLTQATLDSLATGDGPLVVACGRYEGIDARVAEHYRGRDDVRVLEYSLGDYVLNGGEVAALALVEGVVRLLPGVVGNPDSLAEESHAGDGTLEYPVYTRPTEWRGLEIPPVLTSGDHGAAAAWRRERSLERTAARRPDLLDALDAGALTKADRRTLARLGRVVPDGAPSPVPVTVRDAGPDDAEALAALAAATFALACPPGTAEEDIAAFVAEHLTAERMAAHIASPTAILQVAEVGTGRAEDGTGTGAGSVRGAADGATARPELAGYTLTHLPGSADAVPYADDVAAVVIARPAAELSKIYIARAYLGSGLGRLLLDSAVAATATSEVDGEPVRALWLGTNARNRRARKAYERAGFVVVGPRRFRVGDQVHDDVVMVRDLT